ncbi:MAG: hypothetical protein HBSIN02_12450 [Bacteroidia bacterium]|nr:MAG: hypothetical protein HBSIN02_12450 [Bacteroidia bacterium]
MNRICLFCAVLFFFLPYAPVLAQSENGDDLEATLGNLAQDAAKAYIAPIVSGFGADLNSGWFHRAPWATPFGFDLEFGLVAMGTIMEESHRSFTLEGNFHFTDAMASELAQQAAPGNPGAWNDIKNAILAQEFTVTFTGPTIVGSKQDSLLINFPGKTIDVNGTPYNLPVYASGLPVRGLLEEANFVPLGTPQLSLGTFLGTQFTFRYLPEVQIDEKIGKFKYFGFGIQHNPMVWFGGEDALPFEVAAAYFTQNLKIGSLMDASATAYGVNASIRLGWGFLNLTPYAGFLLETSTMKWAYDYTVDTPSGPTQQRIEFEAKGENSSRIVLGASVKILLVNVNVDMNLSKYKTLSAGIMIVI